MNDLIKIYIYKKQLNKNVFHGSFLLSAAFVEQGGCQVLVKPVFDHSEQ